MKVKLELDPDQKETEITIHAGQLTPEIERIYQQLQMDSDHPDQIEGMILLNHQIFWNHKKNKPVHTYQCYRQ